MRECTTAAPIVCLGVLEVNGLQRWFRPVLQCCGLRQIACVGGISPPIAALPIFDTTWVERNLV